MRFSLTIKLFLIVLLVFLGISVSYTTNAAGLGEDCKKTADCTGTNVACDHGKCRGGSGVLCSSDEECCIGTTCKGPEGSKECVGGLFTNGQRAVCLAEGNCDRCDLLMIVKNFFQLLVQIAGALAVLSIVIAGVMYMMGGGALGPLTTQAAAPGVQKAKQALTAAIVGLLIVLFAWSMITWMMHFLGYTHPYGGYWWEIRCGALGACCVEKTDTGIDLIPYSSHGDYLENYEECREKCKGDCYGGSKEDPCGEIEL